jgi:hypothetical protein
VYVFVYVSACMYVRVLCVCGCAKETVREMCAVMYGCKSAGKGGKRERERGEGVRTWR